ncbi:Secretion-regulating guanine nucleotide exchange factor [Mycena sanguinolenta]|uniref:Secretion-regulating guanine nucleotide exchange factor n=1 Tax=Mycena sanguinolenta TaxID=230812 RepID=A0A8H6WWW7_9AGAR|nr:Secretion-regulating guanine nucleotide exchange factor [Mycena sanguinolenta]
MLLSAGSNAHGQLANGSLDDSHFFPPCCFSGCAPETLLAGRTLLHLAFGANHTLALLKFWESGITELWGCGDGRGRRAGQLSQSYNLAGDSDGTVVRPLDLSLERHRLEGYLPPLVAASWETRYARRRDLHGRGRFRGSGDRREAGGKSPAKNTIHIVRFDHLEQNGVAVDEDSLLVESLAAGQHHVVLGDVEKSFVSAPALISADESIVFAALGHQLHTAGIVFGFGSNKKRQLDGIDAITRTRSVACNWNGTHITTTGDGDTWELLPAGNNASGQLGRDSQGHLARVEFPCTPATHRLLQVAYGCEHVLASFIVLGSSTTEVWGRGWNEHWNLGVGTREDVRVPVKIWPSDASQASSGDVAIWAGSRTSWIVVQ